jgi:1,4-dihydroxy-2-naphthoate octaprenyltransferase
LIARAGWPVLWIGLASFLAALAYSGGPLPLGYVGLGDLFVFLFFGPVAVLGTEYVQRLQISPGAMGLSLAMGALSTAILIVNNVRDRHTDRKAGKRTLAVRLGKRGSLVEYALCLGVAYGVAVGFAWLERRLLLLLPLLTLPTAVRLFRMLRDQEGRALNGVLAGTARLLLHFALLFSLGLVWSR